MILEAVDADVVQWLAERHDARFAPELTGDPHGLRAAMRGVRAMIAPPDLEIGAELLGAAEGLRVVGRVSGGLDNIDVQACREAGVEVVRSATATANAEAEFVIGALISLLRRLPVPANDGALVGRELGCSTVGVLGLTPTAPVLTSLLGAFGARVVGYDPALHPSDEQWSRWGIEPLGLHQMLEQADALVVLLPFFERFRGLIGDRLLDTTRPGQVWVSLAHSSLFDEQALARALGSGRVHAAWFDSMEPGWLVPGRPLYRQQALQVTPCLADTTRESRTRSAWSVARRMNELLSEPDEPAVRAVSLRSP